MISPHNDGEVNSTQTLIACPIILLKVGGIETQTLLDTGSHVTCLGQEFYQKNLSHFRGFPTLPVSNGFTREKSVRIRIQVRAPIEINKHRTDVNFLIIPRLIRPCILGIDAQKELSAMLDILNDEVKIKIGGEKLKVKL